MRKHDNSGRPGRLQGKVAIVTGAAMGIGKAAASALAAEGALVILSDVNDAAAEAAVRELADRGGSVSFQHADVARASDVEALVSETVRRHGRLDVMVNNAGIAIPGSVVETSEDDWSRTLNVNLAGVWRGMKYAIPRMKESGGGSIINMSSTQSLVGFRNWAAYAAAKGGINALTQQAAVEYAAFGIRVNAIAPGTIMTPMNERIFQSAPDREALLKEWNSLHPLGRFGEPSEIGSLVAFLASDDASFITGVIIRADGGAVIKGG